MEGLLQKIFLKNGKVDYRDIHLVDIDTEDLVDFSSVKEADHIKLSLIII